MQICFDLVRWLQGPKFYFGGGGSSSTSVAAPVASAPAATAPIHQASVSASVTNPFSTRKKKKAAYLGTASDSDTFLTSANSEQLGAGV